VRLDDAHDHVEAVATPLLGRLEHRERLADPGRGTDEDLEPRARLAGRRFEQGVR
jgi:hypothetical protein